MKQEQSNKLLLVDGHSILNRAFFGLPDMINASGEHINAVHGFLNILFSFIDREQPTHLTVAFDESAPTFRHEIFAEYKGTRKPMVPELRSQVPMMKQMLSAMGVTVITQPGLEADDLLGTMAGRAAEQGYDVVILSGDRDLLQLATDKVRISIPKTKKTGTEIEDYYAADVVSYYGVTPSEFIDMKALMGDSSDNIPGVPGIGEKTAGAIIAQYHSIEAAYEHRAELKPPRAAKNIEEFYEQAQLSKVLATIEVNAPIEHNLQAAVITNLFTPEGYELCKLWGLRKMMERFAKGVDEVAPKKVELPKAVELKTLEELKSFLSAIIDCGKGNSPEKGGFKDGVLASTDFKPTIGVKLVDEFLLALSDGAQSAWLTLSDDTKPAAGAQLSFFEMAEPKSSVEGISLKDVCQALDGVNISTASLKDWVKTFACDVACRQYSVNNSFDTSVAAYLLSPLKSDYEPARLALDYLELDLPTYESLFKKASCKTAYENDPEKFIEYVCNEAYICARLAEVLPGKLKEKSLWDLYEEIEFPLIFTLADMELAGIAMDGSALAAYGLQLKERIAELEQEIYAQAGEEFNINSPKQLGVILFEKLELPGGKKTKTGYSTAADVLEELAAEAPIVADILEYRQLTKLNSTYVEGLANALSPDGRIHSTFQQTVTATGRISSTEPNLQNIPVRMELGKLIRKVFKPKEGCVFLDADYSQIELRVLAHMSGDENLINAFVAGQDIHRSTASLVFDTPFEDVTELQRRNAKAVNFGIVYGISAFGLARDLKIGRKEAQAYIDGYFKAYPRMKVFIDALVEEGKRDGQVKTMYGRIRPIPEFLSSNFMQRQFGERIAMNSPIQGTAADIIKIAMVRVHDRLAAEGLKSRLLLQVHDELLIEADEAELKQVKTILAEEMENAAQLSVKLEIDMHTGANWYDAK